MVLIQILDSENKTGKGFPSEHGKFVGFFDRNPKRLTNFYILLKGVYNYKYYENTDVK